ncbi:MAG: OmpH family outer membrane protein [Verrucomicrobia bacterium]|nr:OmpH family outer membrane protein [Verrucomicrobiota bacterium]OQC65632.1 MAG: periplasmic chaperone [Verrucomicrobia bacterium ADurb.Bin006]MDI9379703.1 OmpH family outer membrane protein [Verrucomicrobiota bacterium]NMD21084.1 OmpH family outer membrane protein [Verrucomicrobiota bacterium]HNV00217.1 OmpH family outer membrane protein [Verrucomicrobiota bacterium]
MNLSLTKTLIPSLSALCLGLALTGLTPTAQAQPKVAVINLKTVFDGYWKTKQSDVSIKDRQAEFEKERKKMVEDYQKANDEYRKMSESASDPAVSGDERDRRKKTAEGKLAEIKEIEQNIQQFDRQFRTQISDQIKRMRDNIMREIIDVVTSKAKAGAYNLVLDTAAESVSQTPVILFNSGTPDLTEEVLTELNAKAPPGSLDKANEPKTP